MKNNTQTHNTQMPHSMKPSQPQSSQPCFFISYFFRLLGQTAGGLPTLECYRVWVVLNEIVWPQHLRPLQPQCHKHLHPWWREKKKHCVQWRLAAINCKKMRQLQSQSRSADSGFGLPVLMLQVLLQDGPCLLEKELLSGSDWRELVVKNSRKWQDSCANKMCVI